MTAPLITHPTRHAQERALERLSISLGQVQDMLAAGAHVELSTGRGPQGRSAMMLFSPVDHQHVLAWVAVAGGQIVTTMPFSYVEDEFVQAQGARRIDICKRTARIRGMGWLGRNEAPVPGSEPLGSEATETGRGAAGGEVGAGTGEGGGGAEEGACENASRGAEEGACENASRSEGSSAEAAGLQAKPPRQCTLEFRLTSFQRGGLKLAPVDFEALGLGRPAVHDQRGLHRFFAELMGMREFVSLLDARLTKVGFRLDDLLKVEAKLRDADGRDRKWISSETLYQTCVADDLEVLCRSTRAWTCPVFNESLAYPWLSGSFSAEDTEPSLGRGSPESQGESSVALLN